MSILRKFYTWCVFCDWCPVDRKMCACGVVIGNLLRSACVVLLL